MDIMQIDVRSQRVAPTPTQAYPQKDSLPNREGIFFPAQNYPVATTVQLERRARKTVSSFISAHLRILVSLAFLLMVGLSFLSTSGLAGGTLQSLIQNISAFTQSHTVGSQDLSLQAHSSFPANASQHLMRISQLDPNQYASQAEYTTWAYSACSTASLTEVFDSFGYQFRITDVLRTESQIGAITPELGLVDPSGIANTAAKFGFKTQWGNNGSLDQIIAIANSGKPVIIGFPPDRYEGGHILVVVGGDSDNVLLADTSLWNRRELSRAQFLQWWGGFYAVVTPNE
ncbi:MAG: C39 family peptidase [Chloroflexota bacterium]|nr:C39 family peptidase [Chloroflexota bacterium]